MKKLIALLIFAVSLFSACACTAEATHTEDCIRIHIRANSNVDCDQSVKLLVRDEIIKHLTPVLADCETKSDAKEKISSSIPELTEIADKCLGENGFPYKADISLRKEEFPFRKYMDYSFPEGVYDALIIELGEAEGDNWWCVAFPPLCFIPEGEDNENFCYKSKIMELIKKARG